MKKSQNIGNKTDSFFGKEEALILSAIAVLIMIWHHLFGYKEFYKEGTEWYSIGGVVINTIVSIFAKIGNICVPMFAIMSGYALGINKKGFDSWKKRGNRLLKFLGSYWLVFALFLIVGYFNGAVLPNKSQFIENLFGINTGPGKWINVSHAWYVGFYVEFLLLIPLLVWMFKSSKFIVDIIAFGALYLLVFLMTHLPQETLIGRICGVIIPLISVGIGILFAKYDVFKRLHDYILKFSPNGVLWIWIFAVVMLRYLSATYEFSNAMIQFCITLINVALPSILVILCVEMIHRLRNIHIRKTLVFIGSMSMYLWFLHGIFHTGNHFLESQLYSLKEPILIYIVALIALIPIAYALDKGMRYIWRIVELPSNKVGHRGIKLKKAE